MILKAREDFGMKSVKVIDRLLGVCTNKPIFDVIFQWESTPLQNIRYWRVYRELKDCISEDVERKFLGVVNTQYYID